MAVALTGTGGLFTRLGRMGKLIYTADTAQAAHDAATDDLFDEYDDVDRPITADALGIADDLKAFTVTGLAPLTGLAERTLLKMVGDDVPAAGLSVDAALRELIRQMRASSDDVKRCTVASSASAFSTNKGNGAIVLTVTRGDGLPQENLIAETGRFECVADSFTDSAAAGNEGFTYLGPPISAGVFDYDYPGYSGAEASFSAIAPDVFGDLGTQVTNGDFETFTVANTPDDWTITVGTPGTHLLEDTSVFYTGTSSLKVPGSATLLNISQALTETRPITAYAFHCWLRTSGVPAAGVLTIDLYSPSAAAVVADDQSVNNSTTVSLPGLSGATWTAASAVFRMPRNPPSDTVLRIRMTTALSGGTDLNLDQLCIAPVNVPYPGGPGIAVFAGSVNFAIGDGWTIASTNNQGGATYGATFQVLFDRFFQMRERLLVLPSDASPTIADTLITS